ncbi:MAG: hypothetical protein WCJ35_21535 [Planctomycetota bacterium]
MITKPRRGVLLLVVLALLAMFAVVAVAFVVLTGVERKSAERVRTIDTVVVSPAKQLNSAFDIVLRGSTNPQSAIGWCSLLEKMYGSNNVPYSGMGVGYSTSGSLLTVTLSSGGTANLALLPRNPANLSSGGTQSVNCEYTAPDHQDPLLAFAVTGTNGSVTVPIPSLHRADLISYWAKLSDSQSGSWTNIPPDVLRQIMFRPNGIDHPNFNGNNQTWDPIAGPRDVDNDGDGVADSVWVDLGFPVSFTADGRPYKPLFAILCLDMDGRLNLNAHGNLAQTNSSYSQYVTLPYTGPLPGDTALPPPLSPLQVPSQFAGVVSSATLPRGQGYGPAEVNLSSLFSTSPNLYQAMLQGGNGQLGRYGEGVGTGLAGISGSYTRLIQDLWSSYGGDYWANLTSSTSADSWGSPPDTQGFGAIGLDVAGRPLYISMGGTVKNTPYDIDLSRNAPRATGAMTPDSPFSVSELERIIRPYDRDASSLPQRLCALTLADSGSNNSNVLFPHRMEVTTESFRVASVPKAFLQNVTATDLPAEIKQGLKMNLNRPFEMKTDSLATRQLYAKDLYTLMMAVADTTALGTRLGDDGCKRLIAQWAINCVAYRDHNSIMIPFKYDGTNTVWGCKRPDLIITETLAFHDRRTEDRTDEKVDPANKQYGADPSRVDPGSKTTEPDPTKKDPNFDQRYRPQGSLFVELFNPWSPLEPQSRDLLSGSTAATGVLLSQTSGGTSGTGSPVWRLIIIDPLKNPPVNGELPDPDDPDPAKCPQIERAVYFVSISKTGLTLPADVPGTAAVYTPSVTKPLLVSSGQYAVIGSGEKDPLSPNKKQTLIGFYDTSKVISNRNGRYITLGFSGGIYDVTTGNPLIVRNNTNNPVPPAVAAIKLPLVLSIDTPRRLSVSEPINGYTEYEKDVSGGTTVLTYSSTSEMYSQTIDIPLDRQRETKEPVDAKKLNNDGTYPGFRIIYLQRLADPTKSWDATTNPYRTIDAMPVDLTTFNGVTKDPDPNNILDPKYPVHFEARQRGDTNAASGENNLWKQELCGKTNWNDSPDPDPKMVYPKNLRTSLGYLNQTFGSPQSTSDYKGDPPSPFPWFNWAYRPFVNEYELLQVPCVSSSKLLANNGNARAYYGYVDQSQLGINSYSVSNFPHLLNMFDSGPVSKSGQSAQFHRILAYVGVPTPYVRMAAMNREPGKINLNTIASQTVFKALGGSPLFSSTWDKFSRSRGPVDANSNNPSRFMRPFRTPGGAALSALLSPQYNTDTEPYEIDYTLLRRDPDDPSNRPLFQVDSVSTPTNNPPTDYNRNSYFRYQALQQLGGVASYHSNVFAVWITVGYFEVTPADSNKKDNKDASGNLIYPDGYQLGQEIGGDNGDINRHRAFYMIDRSIPVEFKRGQDTASQRDAVLVRRFIE